MADTILNMVNLASSFKDFISNNSVDYDNNDLSLRDAILKANDNDFLRVTKKIGSATTILTVDKVDDSFVNKAVLGK